MVNQRELKFLFILQVVNLFNCDRETLHLQLHPFSPSFNLLSFHCFSSLRVCLSILCLLCVCRLLCYMPDCKPKVPLGTMKYWEYPVNGWWAFKYSLSCCCDVKCCPYRQSLGFDTSSSLSSTSTLPSKLKRDERKKNTGYYLLLPLARHVRYYDNYF